MNKQERIDQIDQEVAQILLDMSHIKMQIETAKAKQQMDGVHSDKHWLSRAKYALRLKGAAHQELKVERGKLSRDILKNEQEQDDKVLLSAMKKVFKDELGSKKFDKLFHRALIEAGL